MPLVQYLKTKGYRITLANSVANGTRAGILFSNDWKATVQDCGRHPQQANRRSLSSVPCVTAQFTRIVSANSATESIGSLRHGPLLVVMRKREYTENL